jgi:hypothetical protein
MKCNWHNTPFDSVDTTNFLRILAIKNRISTTSLRRRYRMKITRRSFIQSAGGAAALLVAGSVLPTALGQQKARNELFPIPPEVYPEPLFSMTAKQFEQFIGHSFSATPEGRRSVPLVLTEVNLLEYQQNTINGYYGESFSLIFEAQQRLTLSQDRYEMRTEGLPDFSALIVPTGRRRRQFEVIINRITR